MSRLDDKVVQDLVRSAQKGDGDALRAIYDEFFDRVYSYLAWRTGNRHDAEDLAQNVFLKVARALPGYRRGSSPFAAWLFTIAHNCFVNHCNAKKYREYVDIDEVAERLPQNGDHSDIAESVSSTDSLKRYLGQLTEEQQQVIVMKFVGRFSNEEIAAALRKPVGAVKSLQHRGLDSLARLLQRNEPGVAADKNRSRW